MEPFSPSSLNGSFNSIPWTPQSDGTGMFFDTISDTTHNEIQLSSPHFPSSSNTNNTITLDNVPHSSSSTTLKRRVMSSSPSSQTSILSTAASDTYGKRVRASKNNACLEASANANVHEKEMSSLFALSPEHMSLEEMEAKLSGVVTRTTSKNDNGGGRGIVPHTSRTDSDVSWFKKATVETNDESEIQSAFAKFFTGMWIRVCKEAIDESLKDGLDEYERTSARIKVLTRSYATTFIRACDYDTMRIGFRSIGIEFPRYISTHTHSTDNKASHQTHNIRNHHQIHPNENTKNDDDTCCVAAAAANDDGDDDDDDDKECKKALSTTLIGAVNTGATADNMELLTSQSLFEGMSDARSLAPDGRNIAMLKIYRGIHRPLGKSALYINQQAQQLFGYSPTEIFDVWCGNGHTPQDSALPHHTLKTPLWAHLLSPNDWSYVLSNACRELLGLSRHNAGTSDSSIALKRSISSSATRQKQKRVDNIVQIRTKSGKFVQCISKTKTELVDVKGSPCVYSCCYSFVPISVTPSKTMRPHVNGSSNKRNNYVSGKIMKRSTKATTSRVSSSPSSVLPLRATATMLPNRTRIFDTGSSMSTVRLPPTIHVASAATPIAYNSLVIPAQSVRMQRPMKSVGSRNKGVLKRAVAAKALASANAASTLAHATFPMNTHNHAFHHHHNNFNTQDYSSIRTAPRHQKQMPSP